ncbi:MAG: hypothetical protein HOG08_02305 [Candidatus Magasanikbacteria bacterium]|jgi:F0F1-type ATP synthase membrane subunit c/vacuolar-type H+-ATPase subunit K|nr:hypothetical protein [Candidatus Magasanikbacteria bacterium]
MRKHFTILFSAVAVAIALFTSVMVVTAAGDYGLKGVVEGTPELKRTTDVRVLAGTVIGSALSMIGVLFFILMLYAGFLWMTARGDEGQTTKAKDTIIAAVIGLIIVLSSYAVTRFVFQSVEGGGVTSPVAGNLSPQTGSAGVDCGDNVGFSCKDIKSCSSLVGNYPELASENDLLLLECEAPGNNCVRRLCSGGNEIVCCD